MLSGVIPTYFLFDMEMDKRKWNSRSLLLVFISTWPHTAYCNKAMTPNGCEWDFAVLHFWLGMLCWWCPASILLSFEKLFCLLLLYMNVYVLCTIWLYVGWFHFSFFFFSLLFWFSCLPDYCLAFRNIGSVLKKLIPISTFFSIEEWCCEVEEEPCLCRVLEIENLILST